MFFAEREAREDSRLAERHAAAPDQAASAIIGAGTMGGGIAMAFANAGIPVTLIDASHEALDSGPRARSSSNYERSASSAAA